MNYTRAKLQGSKTGAYSSLIVCLNYTRAKLQGSKTGVSAERYSHLNYTRAKLQGSKTLFICFSSLDTNYTRAKLQGCSFLCKKSRTLCTFASGTACYSILNCIKMKKLPEKISRELLYISEHCVIYFCDKVKTAS